MKLSKIFIVCLCSVTLAGCQGNNAVTVESLAEETAITTTEELKTAAPETTEAETTKAETTEAETTDAETTDAARTPQLPDVGSWDGTTYHNEFAQLTFHLPSEWESTPPEDIPEKLGVTKEFEAQPSASFALLAINPANYAAVTLSFENLGMVLGGSRITEESYSDILKSVVSQSHDYQFEDIYEKELGGNSYTVLECNLPEYGLGLHYYLRKVDNIMICLWINYAPNDSIEEILECFE